ncbi:phage tail sheath subtilisin-like domain-containing protein [Hansschlegelia zhihuaiae]|uniref:Tail sheath protein subtilisin-like domain-containing protein n=1 Tax=Hansschlegelia zhihuaiae TaxID=405005 RepID=A0A4Q0M431_9HYPH|nr:phage tail sheath subtilisin-like domain-containing protein [Hansschlegelia zhihuaiae]RXF67687.1 hypothetical protein EK403_21020 [Hansschlegelia zhihuaiae]
MSIAFNQVPGDIRVPIFAAEINAGPPPYSSISRCLLIGRADEELVEPLTLIPIGSADPTTLFGKGTMLADMALFARQVMPLGELYAMAVPEGESATAAVGSITFSGTAKGRGTFSRYIAGEKYGVIVQEGDTAEAVAAKFRNAVNKGYSKFNRRMYAPVVASLDAEDAETVLLTAVHKGAEGNWIRIDRGLNDDPDGVKGVSASVVQPTGGLGGASVEDALAAIVAEPFDWIGSPWSSTGALDEVRDFMADRWSPLKALYGHYVTAQDGNLAALTAAGALRNDPHATIIGVYNCPHPRWSWVASVTARLAFSKNLGRELATAVEIARPMQTLVLPGLVGPKNSVAVFDPADRDSLLRNGISTWVVRPDGQVALDRVITTYRVNDADLLDTTFLDVESIAIAAYVSRYMRNKLLGQYPRHVMREDNPNGIQGVVTPAQAKACVIHAYEDLAGAGIVRQEDEFAQYLLVEFDYGQDRANFYLPVAKAAALRVFAVNITMFTNLTPAATLL